MGVELTAGLRSRGRIAASLATLLAVAGLLTAMAPWDTGRIGLPLRGEYFLACCVCWRAGLFAGRRALLRLAPSGTGPGFLSLVVLAGSLPGCAGILLTIRLLFGHWVPWLPLYLQTLALGLGIAFAYRGLFGLPACAAGPDPLPPRRPAEVETAPTTCGVETFLQRHAPALARQRLLALQAEDHYLRIHTDGGSMLVLLRLRDAIDGLGAETGWRPHRSFWLARDVPATATRRGQGWQLTLENGLVVPVTRAAAPAMRRAGFGTGQSGEDGVRASRMTVSSTAE